MLALKRAVTRLIKAEVNNAFKGATYPEDITAIEAELKAARRNYERQCAIIQAKLGAGGDRPDYRGLKNPPK
jgi:hypothetical protein